MFWSYPWTVPVKTLEYVCIDYSHFHQSYIHTKHPTLKAAVNTCLLFLIRDVIHYSCNMFSLYRVFYSSYLNRRPRQFWVPQTNKEKNRAPV
jgi:hypothetical protein